MLVQCPECTTKYNLDESKIGHDGSKVRCSRCKNVFTVFRPMTEEVPIATDPAPAPPGRQAGEDSLDTARPSADRTGAPAAGKDSFEDELAAMFEDIKPAPAPAKPAPNDEFEDDFSAMLEQNKPAAAPKPSPADEFEDDLAAMLDAKKPAAAPKPSPADDFEDDLTAMLDAKKPAATSKSSVDEDMIADLQGAFQQPLTARLDDEAPASGARAGKSKKSGNVGLVVGLVFLLLAGAAAGVYFLKPGLIGLGPKAPGTFSTTQEPVAREGAAQIALENVRQYFVPNDKEGQLFIIEGKAVNRFPEARELIRIKAALFDKQGNEVATQEFMCGNVVSLYQLQVSTRADIEAALTAKVGILTNNTNIQSGASVPFMAVFFQTPVTVEEFGLEVIHSSVPQQ